MKKQTRGGVTKKTITLTREENWYVISALAHASFVSEEQSAFAEKLLAKFKKKDSSVPLFLGDAPDIKFKVKIDPDDLKSLRA